MLSLASTIDHGNFDEPKRVGCFSYGSGCCSEFFSGIITKEGQDRIRAQQIDVHLDSRFELSMAQYDDLLVGRNSVKFGTRNATLDSEFLPQARRSQGKPTLFLKSISEYHREYEWVS